MNHRLLALFAADLDRLAKGRTVGPVKWCRPVLALPLKDAKSTHYLVIISESPGPFCFVSGDDPLPGIEAGALFEQAQSARVARVSLHHDDRILRLDLTARSEVATKKLTLLAPMFGSHSPVRLMRGQKTVQVLGEARPRELKTAKPPSLPGPEDDARLLGSFETAAAALADAGKTTLADAHARIIQRESGPIKRRHAAQTKLLKRLAADLDRAQSHEHIRREAETLSAFQSQVPRGAEVVKLPDPYDPERTLRIELDPSAGVQTQIDKRFKHAGKLQKSQVHTRRRIEIVRTELNELAAGLEAIDSAGLAGSCDAALKTTRETKERLVPVRTGRGGGGGDKRTTRQAAPFRQFDLDERWFVWVGRNNQENDELTFHISSPTDLWFHAQGVSGSHVVLRSRGGKDAPSEKILEQTASIAAHFSKARHSELVPVIYTQRKYVRKPRGTKPGQVICEREKMIMVEPQLP